VQCFYCFERQKGCFYFPAKTVFSLIRKSERDGYGKKWAKWFFISFFFFKKGMG
jgi:hypothetical protein